MATQAHTDTRKAAKGGAPALLAALLVVLCTPLAARAEEPQHSQMTVTAAVRSGCQVDVGAPVAGTNASTGGAALQCTKAVEPRTSVAYEVVGAQGSSAGAQDRHLVVTVNF